MATPPPPPPPPHTYCMKRGVKVAGLQWHATTLPFISTWCALHMYNCEQGPSTTARTHSPDPVCTQTWQRAAHRQAPSCSHWRWGLRSRCSLHTRHWHRICSSGGNARATKKTVRNSFHLTRTRQAAEAPHHGTYWHPPPPPTLLAPIWTPPPPPKPPLESESSMHTCARGREGRKHAS